MNNVIDPAAAGQRLADMLYEFFNDLGFPLAAPLFMAWIESHNYVLVERTDLEAYMRQMANTIFEDLTRPLGNA